MNVPTGRLHLLFAFALSATAGLHAQGVTRNPHGTLPQGLDCTSCHTNSSWKELRTPLQFDHDRQTRFPLTGQHATASCLSCHLDAKFDEPKLGANDCSACHVDVHQGRLGTACETCHAPTRFRDVNGIGLHVRTGFPLTGAHLQVACTACHGDARNGAYTAMSSECVSCHRRDYTGATAVDHVAAGFPTDCRRCHNDLSWHGGVTFDHLAASGGKFSLVGAHTQLRCASCHIPPTGTLKWTPAGQNDCASCHQAQYDAAHGGSGFPKSCTDCHTVNNWNSTFDHAVATNGNFPLLGAHRPLGCNSCHAPGTFAPIWPATGANDCVACHQTQYTAAHAGSGYPTTCTSCHTVNNWNASVDHTALTNGKFPLIGAHTTLACDKCHAPGTFTPRWNPADQNDCVACHQADADAAHGGSGFPTTCLSCHTASTWQNATYTAHDAQFFPIYSGSHRGTWSSCATCHNVPSNYVTFTCLSCHEHAKTTVDSHHTGVKNYVYDSQACYSCHPNGRSG